MLLLINNFDCRYLLSILVKELDDDAGHLEESLSDLLREGGQAPHLTRPVEAATLAPHHLTILVPDHHNININTQAIAAEKENHEMMRLADQDTQNPMTMPVYYNFHRSESMSE